MVWAAPTCLCLCAFFVMGERGDGEPRPGNGRLFIGLSRVILGRFCMMR